MTPVELVCFHHAGGGSDVVACAGTLRGRRRGDLVLAKTDAGKDLIAMSIFTREVFASAASSPHGLNVGTVADPVRLTWREVHDQAKRMAGCLAARGIGRHGSVAVLAADAADVAPLAQAIWMRRAALTMLQQPTPRADLAVWLGDTVRAIRMIRADVVVVGEPFLMALDHLAAHDVAVCTVRVAARRQADRAGGRR